MSPTKICNAKRPTRPRIKLRRRYQHAGSEDDYWGHTGSGMTEAWASSVPNRLGKTFEGSSSTPNVSIDQLSTLK